MNPMCRQAFARSRESRTKHDAFRKGDVVEKIQTQMQSGKNVYDGRINDSDFIGTHPRYNQNVQPHRLYGRRRARSDRSEG